MRHEHRLALGGVFDDIDNVGNSHNATRLAWARTAVLRIPASDLHSQVG